MTTYSERRKLGLCGGCGKVPPREGKTHCEKCAQDKARHFSRWQQSPRGRELMKIAKDRYRSSLNGSFKEIEYRKTYARQLRLEALYKIADSKDLSCKRCGCKDLGILTINHKNLGGRREHLRMKSNMTFYKKIVDGSRTIDDLEILCDVCNRTHYAESKSGHRWKIEFIQ